MLTNSQVQELRIGDVVHEDGTCRPFTLTTNARPSKAQTHYEAWAVSGSGAFVVRVSMHGAFHATEHCAIYRTQTARRAH